MSRLKAFLIFDKKTILVLLVLILATFLFSYRILEVPTGLTADEAGFGYNAVLLSRTLHDQNGRFLPFFVLSVNGVDWRQPVTEYYLTLLFWIFGASVFLLRFSSVIVFVVSAFLFFKLSTRLLSVKSSFVALILFLTTPIMVIQSHLGLDNIMPVPFTILWLLCFCDYLKSKKFKFLVFSAVSLGMAFYSYKGMRAIVPVWSLLTILYLIPFNIKLIRKNFRKIITPILVFLVALLPFVLIIPFLQIKYPGAVFDKTTPMAESIYVFLYPYFSSFDPTFLFIKGDATIFHSTGKHGMMLLVSMPFFILGCFQVPKKKGLWLFLIGAFFLGPMLYGLVNSVHRASRLMALVPVFVLITTLGFEVLYQFKIKAVLVILSLLLILVNFYDFINYYWFDYAKLSESAFGSLKGYKSYESLFFESRKRNLKPYVVEELIDKDGSRRFFTSIYFGPNLPTLIAEDEVPPSKSLLLSNRGKIPGMKVINSELSEPIDYYLQKD